MIEKLINYNWDDLVVSWTKPTNVVWSVRAVCPDSDTAIIQFKETSWLDVIYYKKREGDYVVTRVKTKYLSQVMEVLFVGIVDRDL